MSRTPPITRHPRRLGITVVALVLCCGSTADAQQERTYLAGSAALLYVPDTGPPCGPGFTGFAELVVPLRRYPAGIWLGALGGVQPGHRGLEERGEWNKERLRMSEAGVVAIFAGVTARTSGKVYVHGGAGLVLGALWSRYVSETGDEPQVRIHDDLTAGPGLGAIGTAGMGLDVRSLVLRADFLVLGVAATSGDLFWGYGPRLTVGIKL